MLNLRPRLSALALLLLPLAALSGPNGTPPFRTGASQTAAAQSVGTAGTFNDRPAERLTMTDAVAMALQNNLEARIERTGIGIAQSRIRFAAGAFDPVFSIRTSRESLQRQENVNDVRTTDVLRQNEAVSAQQNFATSQQNLANAIRAQQGLPPLPALSRTETTTGLSGVAFDVQTNRSSAGLEGRTPWGMRYGFEIEATRVRNTFTGDTRDIVPEYQTFAGLTVIQPLLRNFGPAPNLAELRLARGAKRVQELEWKGRVSAAVQGTMSAYFDMLFGIADVGVRREAVAAGERLVSQNQRRVEVGFSQPFDVQQARSQVSIDREALIRSTSFFMERQFALKRLILGEFDLNDARIFIPAAMPALKVPRLDRSAFLRDAYANRPDFQQALVQADAEDIRLRFASNQLLPQLDLVASYGLNGLSDSFESSFSRGFQGREPSLVLGLNFQVPLLNLQARARLAEARATKVQALQRIKSSEVTIGNDVDTILERIKTNQASIETARETRELFEEAVRIVYRRVEEGQAATFDVIEQQRRLYDAKSREFAARADLNKSITQLWLVTGTVLEKAGVQLQQR